MTQPPDPGGPRLEPSESPTPEPGDDQAASDAPPPTVNPVLSWTPSSSPPAASDQTTDGPIVSWAAPAAGPAVAPVEGFVMAGVGSRILAYVLDSILIGILGGVLLGIAIVATGRSFEKEPETASLLYGILTLGLEFLYFVGLWTSQRQATLGMRLVSLRLARATDGEGLSIGMAILRFVVMGFPLTLLGSLPVAGVLVSYAYFGLVVFLLFTTAMSPLRQGLHDRLSGSVVVRPAGVSNRGTIIGYALLSALAIGLLVVLPIMLVMALGPEFREILSRIGESI